MMRWWGPFRGRRFACNINEKILHDLLTEKDNCEIDKMKIDNIKMFNNFDKAKADGFKPCKFCCRFNQKI